MNRLRLCIFLLVLSPAVVFAQTARQNESGKFRLHKFEQPIGEENYTITADGSTLTLKTDFKFTDRGTPVPLTATLRTSDSYVPQSFVIKGKTSRMSAARHGSHHRRCKSHHPPGQGNAHDSGSADILHHLRLCAGCGADGDDALLARARLACADGDAAYRRGPHPGPRLGDDADQGRDVQVERYTVQGLIWGMETLWMDSDNNLVALVSTDAEFDHFEAVRDDYEPALSKFVASAAHDEMAALSEMSQKMPGRRTGTFAFVGATLIDGTGKPPIPNATVVTARR